MQKQIVLASNNSKKMKEMVDLLSPMGVRVIAQKDLDIPSVEEPFHTFLENSLAKARHASKYSGLPAIADDSGICVDALNGAPGVFSARYSGENATDESNNQKLIEALKGKENRNAHYTCVITALRSADDPEPLIAVGKFYGKVADFPSGSNGFGYDPYFIVDSVGKRAAELTPEEKNAISHRGQAMRIMREMIAKNWNW